MITEKKKSAAMKCLDNNQLIITDGYHRRQVLSFPVRCSFFFLTGKKNLNQTSEEMYPEVTG